MAQRFRYQSGFLTRGATMLIVIILLALLFLAITKPTEADFHTWMRANIQAGPEAGLLERGLALTVRTQARLKASYHDYAIVAMVDTRMADRRRRFLGIAGQWILIEDSQ